MINFFRLSIHVTRIIIDRYTNKLMFVLILEYTVLPIYFASIFLITVDRLAASLLGIKYNIKCTVFKAKVAVLSMWLFFASVMPSIFGIVYAMHGYKALFEAFRTVYRYPAPAAFMLFLVFATVSYAIMFTVFVQTNRRTSSSQQLSLLRIFARSKFYVAVLLISTFSILQVIPFLVWHYYKYISSATGLHRKIYLYYIVSSNLSDTADALIYIFLYRPVQGILSRNFRSICKTIRNRPSRETSLVQRVNRIAVNEIEQSVVEKKVSSC